jgi:large subunit ribosomal protein L25
MQLKAEIRTKLGKATKYLKRARIIPAVIFGKGMESVSISLNHNEFMKVYKQSGETDLIDITCGDKKYKVLIKDVQVDPVRDEITHVGFYKPDLTIKIEAQVPVVIVGEENNEVVKAGTGILLHLLQEITVEALPEDLPHEFKVDVSSLKEFSKGISISQLDYDKSKVSIPDIDPEEMVVRLEEMKAQEEPEEVITEEEAIAQVEATKEKPEEEGEEGKEEGKKPETKPQERKEEKK